MKLAAILLAAAGLHAASHITERKSLTLDGAEHAIRAAIAQAHKNHAGGVIAIVDEGGNLMALERVDGTLPPRPAKTRSTA
jgi:glc operon protein GlcG